MILMLVYCTLGLLGIYFILRLRRRAPRIPGPKGWPLIGIGLEITQGNIHEKFSSFASQYGDIFMVNIFGNTLVVLNSADFVRKAYSEDPYKTWVNDRKSTFFGEVGFFGSQTVGFIPKAYDEGSVHRRLKKVYTQGMNIFKEGSKEFEDLVVIELKRLVRKIEEHVGEEFEFEGVIRRSLINIISIMLAGYDVNNDEETFEQFWNFDRAAEFALNPQTDSLLRSFPFLRHIPSVYKDCYQDTIKSRTFITKKFFEDARATYRPGVIRGMVDFLLKEQQQSKEKSGDALLTDDRIKAMVMESFAAGVLTTLSTLCSLFLCLQNHPEYQRKIQMELDKVVGRNRLPTMADRQACSMTEAVILETQRYLPALPFPLPHLCRPCIHFEGYEVPANSLFFSNMWYINHDEKVWGDPWTFRPERFLDDDGVLLPNDHPRRRNMLSFGIGRRKCPGESLARSRMFLLVTTLLQRWSFELPPGTKARCDPKLGDFDFNTFCRPKPFRCKAVARDA